VPLEIKQLIIKSKMISDRSQNETFDADESKVDNDNNLPEKGFSSRLTAPVDETRER